MARSQEHPASVCANSGNPPMEQSNMLDLHPHGALLNSQAAASAVTSDLAALEAVIITGCNIGSCSPANGIVARTDLVTAHQAAISRVAILHRATNRAADIATRLGDLIKQSSKFALNAAVHAERANEDGAALRQSISDLHSIASEATGAINAMATLIAALQSAIADATADIATIHKMMLLDNRISVHGNWA
jgi:cytochrome c556